MPDMRLCGGIKGFSCGRTLPHTNEFFNKEKGGKNGLKSYCKECQCKSGTQWAKDNPKPSKKQRANYVNSKYGISEEQLEKLFLQANSLCQICGKPETRRDNTGKVGTLCIDHCHTTNRVRGLLCHRCNILVGMAEKAGDGTDILLKAVWYLKKSKF